MTPQELRDSIIQLALKGKLVCTSSDSGIAFYNKIVFLKKDKHIKDNRHLLKNNDDFPFDIPKNWKWCRFGEIVNYKMGKTPPRSELEWWGKGVNWISIADMTDYGHIMDTKEEVTNKAILCKFDGSISPAGTLIMSFKLTVGRVSILDIPAVHNEAIISIYPIIDEENALRNYLFYVLPFISQYGESKNAIKGKTLNDTSICNMPIPLPPLEEQKRIVAKIEELLPLVKRYEESWNKLEKFNADFPNNLIDSLVNFAMQGKLTEQISSEDTAQKILENIKNEMLKNSNLKERDRINHLFDDKIDEELIPYELPPTWRWCRWGCLVNVVSARRVHQSDWRNEGIPFYRAREIGKLADCGFVNNDLFITKELFLRFAKNGVPLPGDLMVTAVGTLGKSYIVKETDKFYYKDASVICLENRHGINPKYLKLVMESPFMKAQIKSNSSGTTVATLTIERMNEYIIPLPPIEEQQRIVNKLEELLPLCKKLVK